MKRLAVILSILLTIAANAQSKGIREYIAPGVLLFVAGAAEGVMDHLQFHYSGSDPFWQPDISWRNKYRNHDPAQGMTFRGRYLVWTTDGWHAAKGLRNGCTVAAIVIRIGEKKKFSEYLKDAAVFYILNRSGFHLTYKLLNR